MLVGIGGLRHLSGLGDGVPNCFAGETPVTFADGTYGCQLTLNAQSVGAAAPNCAYGSAYIDPNTNDWACPTPPPQPQQSGGLGLFIVAALIAFVAWQYFAPKAAGAADRVSRGKFDDLLPSWMKG